MSQKLTDLDLKKLNSKKGLIALLSKEPLSTERALRYVNYQNKLKKLQIELIRLQTWAIQNNERIIVVFQGRDAAGKGGAIRRITERINPRHMRIVALPKPTKDQNSQWYFQRYIEQLPKAGEMVFFDRSWYNRAGVEKVMGYCTEEEYHEFLRSCPEFERMLVRSNIILLKYWFSVSDEEQERRFKNRIKNPVKRWKFSPMDLESRSRWLEYSKAKDTMFSHTDTKQVPWYVVDADNKKKARLNCIHHILSQTPYKHLDLTPVELPELPDYKAYVRPPMNYQTFVPEKY